MKKELLTASLLASSLLMAEQSFAQEQKKNVLFIVVDDLRPLLGCYGNTVVKTPNIDKLASQGTVFTNAFANYPVSGPSRASFLSGLRPNNTRFTSNETSVESDANDAIVLPQFFKQNGYITAGLGKVFHHPKDKVESWTDKHWHPTMGQTKAEHPDGWRDYLLEENIELCRTEQTGNSYEVANVSDYDYFDGILAKKAIEKMTNYAKQDKPFFLTVGFVKPHLPFNAPKKYFDMYPLENIKMPDNFYQPKNVPSQAMHNWYELRAYKDIPKKQDPMSEEKAKELIRAYYACVSYADAMVGEVLNTLETLKIADNTVVVLIGDHGWNLGEHTLWVKHSNFNNALNTTCIVKSPDVKGGQVSNSLVELLDIYPTLCDLTNQKQPSHLEGKSLLPILQKPEFEVRQSACSKMDNGWSVKTHDYRYTEWYNEKGEVEGRMLYNHKTDKAENENIAEYESSKEIVQKMKKLLAEYVK